jgi:hypothetical protein
MSLKRLRRRVPSAKFIAVATLPKHTLRFHKIGMDGSAKCDAAETDDAGNFIIGVLYDICETGIKSMYCEAAEKMHSPNTTSKPSPMLNPSTIPM